MFNPSVIATMKKLFNDNSDSDGETTVLKTNKEYERVYNSFREKELKQKREFRKDGFWMNTASNYL